MSANSSIEWTDHTFNPWMGCTKVAPACDHCYAERSTPSRTLGVVWGPGQARQRTSIANWKLPERWNAQAEAFQAQHGRRQRVFCASLADVFDNEVPAIWRKDLFDLIARTPNLDWLLLTKRIGNVPRMTVDAHMAIARSSPELAWGPSWDTLPPNVWLGATITSQAEADRDIPKLLNIPARVRFLSMEPLLGPVDLRSIDVSGDGEILPLGATWLGREEHGPRLDWVIVGGESGPQARPMHPDWSRGLRDQCTAAGVPFLFKQWGEWGITSEEPVHPESTRLPGNLCRVQSIKQPDYFVAISTGAGRTRYMLEKVGKKAAGRLLDGVQHDGDPA